MAHAGDGKSLLGGGGGQQRAGAAEQNPLPFAGIQLLQKVPAQSDGTAPAAGAAGMDILDVVVKDGGAAVHELAAQRQTLQPGKLQQSLHAHLPQIPGDDPVEVLRAGAQVFKVSLDGGKCRRG